jgi:hypothetical protein
VTSQDATTNRLAPGQCSGCDRQWTSLREAHCTIAGCHRQFASTRAFDVHLGRLPQSGPQTCRDPKLVTTRDGRPRLIERDGVWHEPGEYPAPQRGRAPAVRNGPGSSRSTPGSGEAV